MKGKIWIAVGAAFVGIMVVLSLLYPRLSAQYMDSQESSSGDSVAAEDSQEKSDSRNSVAAEDSTGSEDSEEKDSAGFDSSAKKDSAGSDSSAKKDSAESDSSDKKEAAEDSSREKAADFTVYDGDMDRVKLSDNIGKPVIVNFWASWCGPCRSELPAFDKLYKKYKDDVVFMFVNMTDGYSETVDGVKDFIEESGYSFPVYYDTAYSAVEAYGIYSIPETVFIDKNGRSVDVRIGAMEEDEIEGYIKKLIAEA